MDKFEEFEKDMIQEVVKEAKETDMLIYGPKLVLAIFSIIALIIIGIMEAV